MSDETWLRNALRAATATQPQGAARATGALHRARQRRRQRVTATSFATVAAVAVATSLASGGSGTTGLRPVSPVPTTAPGEPKPIASPTVDPTPSASASASASPAAPSTRPKPSATPPIVVGAPPEPPGQLDVFFLLDATADMLGAEDAVRRAVGEIVAHLDDRSVAVGYATFRDWNEAMEAPADDLYERLSPIRVDAGPLPKIDYYGGGDLPEAHTLGLDAAIGVGHAPYTTPDQDARFRSGTTKVIVLVSNRAMKEGSGYPTKAEVASRLLTRGVRVVGLDVVTSLLDRGTADLVEVAEATGGVATTAADCDGDGQVDIRRGEAIVCPLDPDGAGRYAGLADLIRNLAE